MTRRTKRLLGFGAGAALVGYLAYGIIDAGRIEYAPPGSGDVATIFRNGRVNGERVGAHGWALSYETLVSSPDQRTIDLTGVHDGTIFLHGKPGLRLRADRAVLDTFANDFRATGHIRLETIGRGVPTVFTTSEADWSGARQILDLPRPIVVVHGKDKMNIASMSVDAKHGDVHMHGFAGQPGL